MKQFIGFLWRKFVSFFRFAWRQCIDRRAEWTTFILASLPGSIVHAVIVFVFMQLLEYSLYVIVPVAIICQFTTSQFFHSRFTFKVGKLSKARIVHYGKYYGSISAGEYLLVIILAEWYGFDDVYSAYFALVIAGIANYFAAMDSMTANRHE